MAPVRLGQQAPATARRVRLGDGPPSEVWKRLLSETGLTDALVDAVRELLAGEPPALTSYERIERLREAGVTRDGALDPGVMAPLFVGFDRAPESDRYQTARETLAGLGTGEVTPGGVRLPRDAETIGAALAPLDATGREPTLAVELTDAFFDRRRDHRSGIAELLGHLATSCDVRVIGTGRLLQKFERAHAQDVPARVSNECSASQAEPAPASAATEERVIEQATALDPDGRGARVLRQLAATTGQTAAYHELYSEHQEVSKARVRQTVGAGEDSLAGRGLVVTYPVGDQTHVELTKLGSSVLERLDATYGRQAELGTRVSQTGKSHRNNRVCCSDLGRGEDGPAGAAAVAGGAAAADDPSPGADADSDSLVDPVLLPHWEHAAIAGSAPDQGFGLVETAREPLTPADQAPAPGWSFDPEAGRLVVAASYHDCMQYWVTTALGLASFYTLDRILDDRLGGAADLAAAGVDRSLLRDARCLGYLPDDVEDWDDYREQLRDARRALYGMLTDYHHLDDGSDQKARMRGELLRAAHGLAGTMVHLLDAVDVTVTREIRLQCDASRHLGDNDANGADRDALVRTLAIGAAIQSRYGHFAAYRQLFETRTEKQPTVEPTVDAADPIGDFIGNAVLVGPGVSTLAEDLRAALRHPSEQRDEAPEFAVQVGVRETAGEDRRSYAQAARYMARQKGLEPTRTGVRMLHALARTPYDATRALNALQPESVGDGVRDLGLDEVTYALSTLPADGLLRDVSSTPRALLHGALQTDGPVTQTELCELADCSTRSARDHLPRLAALGLLQETADGYVLGLPIDVEDDHDALPWYALPVDERDGDHRTASVVGAVQAIAEDWLPPDRCTGDDPVGQVLQWPPDLEPVVDAWPWLDPWLGIVSALTPPVDAATDVEAEAEAGQTVLMGPAPTQQPVVVG